MAICKYFNRVLNGEYRILHDYVMTIKLSAYAHKDIFIFCATFIWTIL